MLVLDDVQSYSLNRTVAPVREPITTAEAIRHLRRDAVVDVDSVNDTSSTDFSNVTNPLTVTSAVTTYTLISFVSGMLVKIGQEVMEVTLVSGNDVTFARGQFGTKVRSHAASIDMFVSNPDEDDIRQMVVTAREYVEEYQWSALMTQTLALRLDRFPPQAIEFPRQPLVSVSSVVYNDADNTSTTLTASTDYTVDANSKPGRIVPAYTKSWPSTRGHINDVTVTFIAGYGAATAVPQRIKHAMKLIVSDFYNNREAEGTLTAKAKTTIHRLLDFDSFRGVIS